MSTPFVTTLSPSLHGLLKDRLEEKGFILTQPQYTIFQARSPSVTCVLYSSGKLVVQGKGSKEFIKFFLEPEILLTFTHNRVEEDLRPRLGVDESGKGDFFGPLCIAGVYAKDEETLKNLYKTKIQDSKLLNDAQILSLAKTIRASCSCDVMILYPEKYNELYGKFHNLNILLAWAHATIIDQLAPRPSGEVFAISDQFASSESVLLNALRKKNTDISVIQKVRAEQDIVVAAASILAREAFITAMTKLEQRFSLKLPKGASAQVKSVGKSILNSRGKEVLSLICKTHFKTFNEICDSASA
ncbi:ribonuclease HIII [Chlamydia caviae]|uniref:Ribonuclease HIII n=1 Tax=Chlamydia caviae (strain ATCC VR-813 / DSM 19441 / 03DC25 / GPIC) TaxID=227941 RepID=RNH3_CHLCV|nr:ribonuclease HIII [Chlamydia caviae]Q823W2.1 RecName: Full=Ribonuclease HIII; Short=RNase HIII [Chlamydia caviae GPIC]AAP05042.1 ribonuclease HIII [Chlamydia caviae GPIC]